MNPDNEANPLDKLLAKLSEQQSVINKQHEALKGSDDTVQVAYARTVEYVSASSAPPATDAPNAVGGVRDSSPSDTGDDRFIPNDTEVARLKAELEAARGKIARMDQELAQNRITKHTIDQAIGAASEVDYPLQQHAEGAVNNLSLPSMGRPPHSLQRESSWAAQDDARSDTSDALSANGFNRARGLWDNSGKPAFGDLQGAVPAFQPADGLPGGQWMNRGFAQPFSEPPLSFPGGPINGFRGDRMMPESEMMMGGPSIARRNPVNTRFSNRSSTASFPYAGSNSSYDGFTPGPAPYSTVLGMAGSMVPMGAPMGIGLASSMNNGMGVFGSYQPQPIGTPLSPHAPEFTSTGPSWKNDSVRAPSIVALPVLIHE